MLHIEADTRCKNGLSDSGKPFRYLGKDDDGFICAELRWDGCMNLWIKGSVEEGKEAWTTEGQCEEDCDYIHLCDPIETLERVLAFAKMARDKHKENGMWMG